MRGSNHPAAARAIPVVGDVHALDLERVLTLAPDLVVTWPYTTPLQVGRLKERGIAVFTTDPATLDGIATDLVRLGTLTGNVETAAQAAARFRAAIASATANVSGMRVSVFVRNFRNRNIKGFYHKKFNFLISIGLHPSGLC